MSSQRKHQLLVAVWLLIGLGGLAAGLISGDELVGFWVLGLMLLSIAAFELSRAKGWGFGAAILGVGDEYARGIYRQAGSRTTDMFGTAMAVWVLVIIAKGEEISSTLVGVMLLYSGLWVANISASMYIAARRSNANRRAQVGL